MKNRFNFYIKSGVKILLALIFATGFYSCNDDPTTVGYSLVYDTVTVFPVTSEDANSELIEDIIPYNHFIRVFNFGAIFIGANTDTKSASFVRFVSIPDSLIGNNTELISAKLIMSPNRYVYGDSVTNALAFNVYRVNDYWSSDSEIDSMGFSDFSFSGSPIIDYTNLLASYDEPILLEFEPEDEDSLQYIEMGFNTDIIYDWMRIHEKYLDGDTSEIIWGIALLPDENNCSLIRSFAAEGIDQENASPHLEILFINSVGEQDTLILESAIDKSLTCVKDDENYPIRVQGNVSYRTELKFDLSIIPRLAAIHKADLRLTIDTARSAAGNMGLDSTLIALLLVDDVYDGDVIAEYYGAKEEESNDILLPNLISAVEMWVRDDSKGSLFLKPGETNDEYYEMDRLVFFGLDNEDVNKRPYLRIIYSGRPDFSR